MIASFMFYCIVVFCIMVKFTMKEQKRKFQENHEHQPKIPMIGGYKVNDINNLLEIHGLNVVKLEDSGEANKVVLNSSADF